MTEARRDAQGAAPDTLLEKLTVERGYAIKDFTALRAYVQRISPAVITRTYCDADEGSHAATRGAMGRHLNAMLCSTRSSGLRSRAAQPRLPITCARPSVSMGGRRKWKRKCLPITKE